MTVVNKHEEKKKQIFFCCVKKIVAILEATKEEEEECVEIGSFLSHSHVWYRSERKENHADRNCTILK